MIPEKEGKKDWRAVAVDETAHYQIDEEDRPFVEKILGVYLYDATERTFCCELTPSYYLRHVYDEVIVPLGTPDEDRNRVQEKYAYLGGEDCYVWCSRVSQFATKQFGDGEFDEVVQEVQGNPPW